MAFSGAPTRGPFLLLAHIGLPRRHAVHRQRQPPRRHERLGAVIDQPGRDQPVGDQLAQILRRPRLHPRGDFLGEKFKQKVGHDFTARGASTTADDYRAVLRDTYLVDKNSRVMAALPAIYTCSRCSRRCFGVFA